MKTAVMQRSKAHFFYFKHFLSPLNKIAKKENKQKQIN